MATAAKKKPVRGVTKRATPAKKPAQATAPAAPGAAPAQPAKAAKTAKAAKPAKPAKTDNAPKKADKPKKPKLVRDSFAMPKAEYAALGRLKERAATAGKPVKKSELLRAGIQALAGMQDGAFLAALAAVPALKTGRPAKD